MRRRARIVTGTGITIKSALSTPIRRAMVVALALVLATLGGSLGTAASAQNIGSNNWAHTENGYAPLFRPNNSLWAILPLNDLVDVTCYYVGNMAGWLGDGFEDHVVSVNGIGAVSGHIPDAYINLGGRTPPQVGIPPC